VGVPCRYAWTQEDANRFTGAGRHLWTAVKRRTQLLALCGTAILQRLLVSFDRSACHSTMCLRYWAVFQNKKAQNVTLLAFVATVSGLNFRQGHRISSQRCYVVFSVTPWKLRNITSVRLNCLYILIIYYLPLGYNFTLHHCMLSDADAVVKCQINE
jgi:hypothetical protein